jgi:hypothetical protein
MQKQENGVCQWWARWRHFDCSHCIAGGASFYPKTVVLRDIFSKLGNVGILFYFRGRLGKKILFVHSVKKRTNVRDKDKVQLDTLV